MLTLKICVGVFSETWKARMLELGIHIDNDLLYCGMENQTTCSYSSLYLSIFLSFMAKFMSQFSPELCKLESSNMVYICRMSDIVGLRLRVMALIFLYLSIFLSFPILHANIKICVGVFSKIFKARMLKLGIPWTMSCCIMGLRIILLALILLFICPFFIQFSLFLYIDCLEFVLQFSLQLIYCSFYVAVPY